MTEDEIKIRLEEAVATVIALPCEMRKMDFKSGMPEIIKTEDDWDFYDAKNKTRFRPTPKQVDEAMEVMDWIREFTKTRPERDRKVWVAVIWLKSSGMGYRRVADVVGAKFGKSYSHQTCKNWYLKAVSCINSIGCI